MKKLKAVAYCRVSTSKEEQLDSLKNQASFFLEYAKRHNYELINIYADEGKSGTRIKHRIELQQLLIDAKEKMFELVLIKDVSRLARNTVDFLTSIRKLKSYGIKVMFINYDQTSSDSSEFMLTMLSAIAQEESANISKRVKFGKRVNAEKGKVPNLCYGFNKIQGDYFSLDINKEEALVVKQIFEMYTIDLMGTARIAKELNKRGVKTKRNCQWTQTGIVRILSNEIYTGKVVNGKEEVVDFLTAKRCKTDKEKWIINSKPELQIISNEIYMEARTILEERKSKYRKTGKRNSDRHVFSKLIYCEHCNYNYRRIVRTYKNTYIRWVCNGRNSNGVEACPNKIVIDEQELIDWIKKYCVDILCDKPKYGKYIVSEFSKRLKEEKQEVFKEKTCTVKLQQLEESRDKYINLYQESIISLVELKNYIVEINENKEYLQNELKLIRQDINKIDLIKNTGLRIFKYLDLGLKKYKLTNTEVKKLIRRIRVKEDGEIGIYIIYV